MNLKNAFPVMSLSGFDQSFIYLLAIAKALFEDEIFNF